MFARDRIVELLMYGMMIVLLGGFYNLQIRQGDTYLQMSEDNRIRTIPILSARGRIYDRNGRVLADNKAVFSLSIIPSDFDLDYCDVLADILSIDSLALQQRLSRAHELKQKKPLRIKTDISRTALYRVEELSTLVGGIVISQDTMRYYPEGDRAAHVVGYIGKINKQEYRDNKHKGWLINDYVGRLGTEKSCNELLMGTPGGQQIEVDARGRQLRVLSYKDPLPGKDVHLSVDINLQSRIIDLLDEQHHVSVCVVDIHTGEILSLVSTPLFDPNMFFDSDRRAELQVALHDKRYPFVNRPVSLSYPLGSVFKVLVGLAALEEGVITSNSTFHCSGEYRINDRSRPFKCWNPYGHKDVNLNQAIAQSCNVFFYRVGLKLGNARIARYARMFGFGEAVDLGLPYSKGGLVPDAIWKRNVLHERWYPGETVNFSIGQGFLEVTPLQVAKMMIGVATGGTIVEPHVVEGHTYPEKRVPISRKNFAIMRGCMLRAVDSEWGTASLAAPSFFKAAGKTGTAQTSGEPHSWFAGFFPYNNPQIALVVMAEHAGPGGVVAAGYAGKIADLWSEYTEGRLAA